MFPPSVPGCDRDLERDLGGVRDRDLDRERDPDGVLDGVGEMGERDLVRDFLLLGGGELLGLDPGDGDLAILGILYPDQSILDQVRADRR